MKEKCFFDNFIHKYKQFQITETISSINYFSFNNLPNVLLSDEISGFFETISV